MSRAGNPRRCCLLITYLHACVPPQSRNLLPIMHHNIPQMLQVTHDDLNGCAALALRLWLWARRLGHAPWRDHMNRVCLWLVSYHVCLDRSCRCFCRRGFRCSCLRCCCLHFSLWLLRRLWEFSSCSHCMLLCLGFCLWHLLLE